jgi:hypothetical protein
MKPELYQIPTLALLSALVAVFAGLWLDAQTQATSVERISEAPPARRRQLMWLIGWGFAVVRLVLLVNHWDGPGLGESAAQAAMQLAPLLFLGSLAPQYFLRKPPVLYVVAFGLPILVYCAVIGFDEKPGAVGQAIILVCTFTAIAIAARWSLYRHLIPNGSAC